MIAIETDIGIITVSDRRITAQNRVLDSMLSTIDIGLYLDPFDYVVDSNYIVAQAVERLFDGKIQQGKGDTTTKGGQGSGNFGHRGRPGERGGSAPDGGSSADSSSDARSVFKTRSPKSLTRKEWKGIFAHAEQMVKQGKAKDAMSYVAMAISSSKFAKKPKVGGSGLGKFGSGGAGKQSKKKTAAEEPKKEPPGKPEKKEIEKWKVIGKTESYSDDPDLALFDLNLTNDEIDTVLDRIPNAKPLPLAIPDDKMEAYRRQYDFWREQGSSDWDRVLKIEEGDKFAPLVVGGTPDRWWALDGSHRLAILAKQKRTKVLAYFDNPKVYKSEKAMIVIDIAIKGGEGSGFHGHAGRPGEVGGSAYGRGQYPPKVVEKLNQIEGLIAGLKYESMYAIDPRTGNLILNKKSETVTNMFGNEHLEIRLGPGDLYRMRDKIVTHNHPSEMGFSPPDIGTAMRGGVQEIRAVTPSGTIYRMIRTEETEWNYEFYKKEIEPLIHNGYRTSIERAVQIQGRKLGLSQEKIDVEARHAFWEDVAENLGLDYRRELPSKSNKSIVVIDIAIKGGEGSGNFGHAGRPGEVGGSAPRDAVGGTDNEYDPRTYFQKRSAIVTTASEWKKIAEHLHKLHQDGEISNPFTYLMKTLQKQGQTLKGVPKDLFAEFAKDDLEQGLKWLDANPGVASEDEIFAFLSDSGKSLPEILGSGMKVDTPFTFLSPEKWADLPGANFEKVLDVASKSPTLYGEKGGYKIIGELLKRDSYDLNSALSKLRGRFPDRDLPKGLVDEIIEHTQGDQSTLRNLPLVLDAGAGDMPEVWHRKLKDISVFVLDDGSKVEVPANGREFREWLRGGSYDDGRTYTPNTIYTAEEKARRKDLATRSVMESSDLSYEESNAFLYQWGRTSNDTDMRSLGIQEAAVTEFDSKLSPWQKEQIKKTQGRAKDHPMSQYLFEDQGGKSAAKEKIRKAVRSTYESTQKALKDLGFDQIHVYRGVILSDSDGLKPGSVIQHEDSTLSSWSISPRIAKEFASEQGGVVVSMVVPRERVFSTSLTGFGVASEEEVIVISKKKSSKALVEFVYK